MESILLIGVFLPFFLAVLVFTKKERSVSDHILGSFFLLYAVNIFLSYMQAYNRQNGYLHPAWIQTATPLLMLHGPALWFYIKSLTDQQFRLKPGYLLHFLPFLIVLAEHYIHFYTLPAQQRIEVVRGLAFREHWAYTAVVVAIAVSQVGYFSWGLAIVQGYRKKIKTYFSHLEPFSLEWLRQLLIAAVICYGIIHLLYLTDLFYPVASFGILQVFSYTLGTLYLVFLGFFGLRQGNLFHAHKINLNLEEAAFEKPGEPPLQTREEQFIQKLQNHMREKKPYLTPDLTIARLSNQLEVTPEYLSKILNGYLKCSFFDFVNHYRIEEFKAKCLEDENSKLTLMGLAYDSGFNSKATFNRVFKNATGLTPGAYFRQVSEK